MSDLKSEIAATTWTFAKTYAYKAPHEYMLKKDNEEVFNLIEEELKNNGFDKKYYAQTFRYVNIGNYKYWGYDDLMNREPLNGYFEPEIEYLLANLKITGRA